MHILATGGAGYIGSHARRALAAAGFTPVAYDNLSKGRESAVRWGPLEVGEMADRARLAEVFEVIKAAGAVVGYLPQIQIGPRRDGHAAWSRGRQRRIMTLVGYLNPLI